MRTIRQDTHPPRRAFIRFAILSFLVAVIIRWYWGNANACFVTVIVICIAGAVVTAIGVYHVDITDTLFHRLLRLLLATVAGFTSAILLIPTRGPFNMLTFLVHWGIVSVITFVAVDMVTLAAWAAFKNSRQFGSDHHCRRCGYDLTGNTSGICPECGKLIGDG